MDIEILSPTLTMGELPLYEKGPTMAHRGEMLLDEAKDGSKFHSARIDEVFYPITS